MKTNKQLIEKYQITADSNQITLISSEDVTKQITAVLITNPDNFENLWIGQQEIAEDTIIIDLYFKADLDKFLSIIDFRKVLLKYFETF